MYCRNCGRKLRAEAKFCDHCGEATAAPRRKTQTNNTASRSTTQKQQTPKSRERSEYERNKRRREEEKKRVQRNRKIVLFLILIAIVAATVLGFASYNMTKKELNKDNVQTEEPLDLEPTEEPEETEEPEATQETEEETTEKPTEKPSEKEEEPEEKEEETVDFSDVEDACKIYRDDRMDSIRCPYPESFEQGSKSNKNTILSLVDPLNDGSMMICAESVGTGKTGSSLMKSYAGGIGGEVTKSRAGDDWYEITFKRNNKINHRKAVVVDGLCVYYDFSYDVDSSETDSYEQYIGYIDHYLDKELTSAAKEKKTE